jgi:hypothetical protein
LQSNYVSIYEQIIEEVGSRQTFSFESIPQSIDNAWCNMPQEFSAETTRGTHSQNEFHIIPFLDILSQRGI